MKDKILEIVAEHCVGWKNCEALTEKLFDLYSVSQQRELLPKRLSNTAYRKAKTLRYEEFVKWWDEQV